MNTSPADLPAEVTEQLAVFAPTDCALVLHYFHQHSTEVATVEELSGFIRKQKQSDADESQIAIQLHHSTLPKLTEKGLIDYDSRSTTVRHVSRPMMEVNT